MAVSDFLHPAVLNALAKAAVTPGSTVATPYTSAPITIDDRNAALSSLATGADPSAVTPGSFRSLQGLPAIATNNPPVPGGPGSPGFGTPWGAAIAQGGAQGTTQTPPPGTIGTPSQAAIFAHTGKVVGPRVNKGKGKTKAAPVVGPQKGLNATFLPTPNTTPPPKVKVKGGGKKADPGDPNANPPGKVYDPGAPTTTKAGATGTTKTPKPLDWGKWLNTFTAPAAAAVKAATARMAAFEGPDYTGLPAKAAAQAKPQVALAVQALVNQQIQDRLAGKNTAAQDNIDAANQARAIMAAGRASAQLMAPMIGEVNQAYRQAGYDTAQVAGGAVGPAQTQQQSEAQQIMNQVNAATGGGYTPTTQGGENVQTNPAGMGAALYESKGYLPAANFVQEAARQSRMAANVPQQYLGYSQALQNSTLAQGRIAGQTAIKSAEQAAQGLVPSITNQEDRLPTLTASILNQLRAGADTSANARYKALAGDVTAKVAALTSRSNLGIAALRGMDTAAYHTATTTEKVASDRDKAYNDYVKIINTATGKRYSNFTSRIAALAQQSQAATAYAKYLNPAAKQIDASKVTSWVQKNIIQKVSAPATSGPEHGQPGRPFGNVITNLDSAAYAMQKLFPTMFTDIWEYRKFLVAAQGTPPVNYTKPPDNKGNYPLYESFADQYARELAQYQSEQQGVTGGVG